MYLSPSRTRSGVLFNHSPRSSLTMPDEIHSESAQDISARSSSPPLPTPPSASRPPPSLLNTDLVPLWTGDDPAYSVFTFIRRVEDAISHASLTDAERIAFLRACMSCDVRTAAGAALEDDFYSTCTNFREFCHQLIKEFACHDNDPCLASMVNLSDLILTNSGTMDPRDAAGVAGRFRTEFCHSLEHSQWINQDGVMPKSHLLSLFSYFLYTNLLKPQAAQMTKDISFLPTSTIHDLKISVESKLRAQTMAARTPHPPPSRPTPVPASPVSLVHTSTSPPSHPILGPAFSTHERPPPPLLQRQQYCATRDNFSSPSPPSRGSHIPACFNCGGVGHSPRDCPSAVSSHFQHSQVASRPTQQDKWCHYHKTYTHSSAECFALQKQRHYQSNFR